MFSTRKASKAGKAVAVFAFFCTTILAVFGQVDPGGGGRFRTTNSPFAGGLLLTDGTILYWGTPTNLQAAATNAIANSTGFGTNTTLRGLTLPTITTDRVAIIQNGNLTNSAIIDLTELGFLDGVTSGIQGQINGLKLTTNGNQFGPSLVLTLKDGLSITNPVIQGNLLAGTNGWVQYGDAVNFSFFTNWNSTIQQGSWRMNVSGQGTYIQDGAFVSVENGSVILVGINTGSGVSPSSIRFGSNDYVAFTEIDNNEIYRYRGWTDITGNKTNQIMRWWETSNFLASASVSVAVPMGGTIYVTTNGNDSTGLRGRLDKPFLRLTNALAASKPYDTIYVLPGTYTERCLLSNNVNWYFMEGSVVTNWSTVGGWGLFDDRVTGPVTCFIDGQGEFAWGLDAATVPAQATNAAGAFVMTNALTRLVVHGRKGSIVSAGLNGSGGISFISSKDGTNIFVFDTIVDPNWGDNTGAGGGTEGGDGIFWQRGDLFVSVRYMKVEGYCLWSEKPVGTFTNGNEVFLEADWLISDTLPVVYHDGANTNVNWKTWVRSKNLQSENADGTATIAAYSGGKVYVDSERIAANGFTDYAIRVAAGPVQLWVTAQKVVSAENWFRNDQSNALAWIKVLHWEDTGGTSDGFRMDNGTNWIEGGYAASSKIGINHGGGLATFSGTIIDTSAGTSITNLPVLVRSNGLTLRNVTLIAPAVASNAISAPSAFTVDVDGSLKANTNRNANVTLRGGFFSPSQQTSLQLPAANGANGTVMTNNGSGTLNWWDVAAAMQFVATNQIRLAGAGIITVTASDSGGIMTWTIGGITNTTGTGPTFVLQGGPTISNTLTLIGTVGVQQPGLKFQNTVGNGYFSFANPQGWIPTNNFSFKFTNVQAGQIVGIASAVVSSGIGQIDLTNIPAPSASGGGPFNVSQFDASGSVTSIVSGVPLTNFFNYGSASFPTAGKFSMFAGAVSNGWYGISSVSGQTLGHVNGSNQNYRFTITTHNTNTVVTNLEENVWYTLVITNSGSFTNCTIQPFGTANYINHPTSLPVMAANGITTLRFIRNGTFTNVYDEGIQLELAAGPGIVFTTNGASTLRIAASGAPSQFSPASANGDPLVIVSNAFLTNVTLFGNVYLNSANGGGDYGIDFSAIGRIPFFDGVNNALIYDVTSGLYAPAGYGDTNGLNAFPWRKSFNIDVFARSNVFAQFIYPTNVGASQLVRTDSGGKLAAVTIGSGITFDGTTISSSGGTGGTNFGGIIVTNTIERGTTNAGSATALTIDWKGPMYWHGTPSGNLTLSFANTPSAGDKGKTMFIAIYTNTSFTVTWPSSIDWRGINPVTVSGITNLYVLDFDGTNLYGFSMQNNTTGSNQVYVLQSGPTISNAMTIAGQLLFTAENFNGSNGVTATALTNIWDMSTAVFKPITNFVGTNLTFIISNPSPTRSIISELIGLPGTTNKLWITAVPGVNLKWKGWDTNIASAGVSIRGGYSYTIQAFADRSTNVSLWVTTDEPAPPITITTNDLVINTRYTNTSLRLTYVQCSMTLNAGVTDIAQAVLLIDQNADGTFDTWITNRIGSGVAMADSILVGGWVTNGGIYMITNQSTGSATATINPNSSQVVSGFGAVNVSGPQTQTYTYSTSDFVATNSTANSNLTVNFSLLTREIYVTNNISLTNYINMTAGVNAGVKWRVIPQLVNRSVVWPAVGNSFGMRFGTNAGSPLWTTLTNGTEYWLSWDSWNTNIVATITAFSFQ